MLSVIIPSRKDPLLHKTIESLLKNAECRHTGGRVIVNNNTWYAHAHIASHYTGGTREREKSREYMKIFAKQIKYV